MNFISREAVLAILDDSRMCAEIERLPSFPAPNPDWAHGQADRNVMGQTEDQFWDAIDSQK